MGIAQTDHVAVVCPNWTLVNSSLRLTVIENAVEVAGSRVDYDAKLEEHLVEHVASQVGLDDVGTIQAVDTAVIRSKFFSQLTWS